jgi:hypothetical protein
MTLPGRISLMPSDVKLITQAEVDAEIRTNHVNFRRFICDEKSRAVTALVIVF